MRKDITYVTMFSVCDKMIWQVISPAIVVKLVGQMIIMGIYMVYIDDLAQDCSNSIANARELLQSCAKPSIWGRKLVYAWAYFQSQQGLSQWQMS